MSTTQNVMPARAVPQANGSEAAPNRSHLVLACGPSVGASTLSQVIGSLSGAGAKRRRVVPIADRMPVEADDGEDLLDFSSEQKGKQAFVPLAEAIEEGVIVDCAAGAVDRIFAEAAAARIGHHLTKVDVTAMLAVGRAPVTARRASAHLRSLEARAGDLGVRRTVVVLIDTVGGHDPWRSESHQALRSQAEKANIKIATIPAGDLDLVERVGFAAFTAMTETDLATKVGGSAIRAAAEKSRFANWLKASGEALRAVETVPTRAAAPTA